MPDDTRTVYSTLPLLVGGTKRPSGTPMVVSPAEAQALIEEGRATEARPGNQADGDAWAPDPAPEPAPAPSPEA